MPEESVHLLKGVLIVIFSTLRVYNLSVFSQANIYWKRNYNLSIPFLLGTCKLYSRSRVTRGLSKVDQAGHQEQLAKNSIGVEIGPRTLIVPLERN